MAARFPQQSWSSGKTRLTCRSRTKLEVQLKDQVMVIPPCYHGEMEHRVPQWGSEEDVSPQEGEQTQEGHGWVQGHPEQNQKHFQHSWDRAPGLSLNGAPKPVGRGCGRTHQERLIRVIKAHYWPQCSPETQDTAIRGERILLGGLAGGLWHDLPLRSIGELLSG